MSIYFRNYVLDKEILFFILNCNVKFLFPLIDKQNLIQYNKTNTVILVFGGIYESRINNLSWLSANY